MKVRELIALLQQEDPDADVLLGTQEHYPFENTLVGVVRRDEALSDEDGERDLPGGGEWSDVLLLEGTQVRYGDKGMWACARRR